MLPPLAIPLRIRKASGFSLPEVLIALGLLGVIAAFTINKVLVAQGKINAFSRLKEAYSTVDSILYNAHIEGELRPETLITLLDSNLNYTRRQYLPLGGENCTKYWLTSGATISLCDSVSGADRSMTSAAAQPWLAIFLYDWNDDEGTNTYYQGIGYCPERDPQQVDTMAVGFIYGSGGKPTQSLSTMPAVAGWRSHLLACRGTYGSIFGQ